MALGADLLSAQLLINRNLPFTAIIPCENQSELWYYSDQLKYNHIRLFANNETSL